MMGKVLSEKWMKRAESWLKYKKEYGNKDAMSFYQSRVLDGIDLILQGLIEVHGGCYYI